MAVPPRDRDYPACIDRVILHHLGKALPYSLEDARRDHVAKGWGDIAYHYGVTHWGGVRLLRRVDLTGTHDKGENTRSIGVVLEGRYDPGHDTLVPLQWEALVTLLADLLDQHDLPTEALRGHGEDEPASTPTICPGVDMATVRLAVRSEREHRRATHKHPLTTHT